MKFLLVPALAVGLAATALAGFPFKKKPEYVSRKPDEVAHILQNGTPVERNNLALELGIFAPNPSKPGADSNSPCVSFHHVEARPVKLRAGGENVVLLADSRECDSLYLAVFDKAPKSEWRHVGTLRLLASAPRPQVSFAELIRPGVSEILVHKETTRDGGAVQQQDFVVLKLIGDRLEVIMDATEHSDSTLTNRNASEADNLSQTQTSTFDLLKASPNSTATYRVLEREVITDNKTAITRYRVWTWDPELERFRPAPFDGGEARPAPPPAQKPPAKTPAPTQPTGDKSAPDLASRSPNNLLLPLQS